MENYTVTYRQIEDGWWFARCVEVPEAFTQGETLEEAREMIRDALGLVLEGKREDAMAEAERSGAKIERLTL